MASPEHIASFKKLCRRATDNDTEVLQLIEKRFSKADKSFLASQKCLDALKEAAINIKNDGQNKFVHLKKFLSLLKANDRKKRKKCEHESDSSEPIAKRPKKSAISEYSDGSESGPGGSERHTTGVKSRKKEITLIGSDSDTEPLTSATSGSKVYPKCEKKQRSEENAKKKPVESDSDTEPLSIINSDTKEFQKREIKAKSVSPPAKEVKKESPVAKEVKKESPGAKAVKSESPAKDDDQQLTILPLTPSKQSSPEKTDAGVPTSYISPTARYKHCKELRLTDDDDDKCSTTSVKKNSDEIITMHIPRRKVARIVLKPLTPKKLPNGKTAIEIPGTDRTPKHVVDRDRSPVAATAAVTSPGPEYVFVSLDQNQQEVCEQEEAEEDRDCEVMSDVASTPDLDDNDAVDLTEEDEEEEENEAVEQKEEEEEEDGPAPIKGSRKQLKKLEVLLDKISAEIRKLENKELTLDELEDENSAYAMEDRYKKKFCQVWDKYCQVAGRPPTTGRPTERKFRFEGTRYPEVNKKIERFVNMKQVFPDYHDIRDIIGKVNKKYHLRLRPTAVDNLAREAFTVVGNELQKRRMLDFSTDFESRLDEPIRPYSDPALFDRGLRDRLEKNKKTYKSRMTEVLEKYARKQDDGDGSDDTDEEEEEEEEAAPSEDEAESDIEKMFSLPITSLVKIKAAAEAKAEPSTSRGGEEVVRPEAGVETVAEPPTEQDNFMSAFGLRVAPQPKKYPPPPADEEVDKKSIPQVEADVDVNMKYEKSVEQTSAVLDMDEKDKQSISQAIRKGDKNARNEQSIPKTNEKSNHNERDEQSIPKANETIDLDEKDAKSPAESRKDVDLDEEEEKCAPQVYKQLDIDDDLEPDENFDDDEDSQRQVYKQLDIDEEEMDMDHESEDDENSQRQVYKQLDIDDEEFDVDHESDDDEENQRQVYKELDIDEKSEGGLSQHETADGSQDLFEGSDDNAVNYEKMEDSPKIVPYEDDPGSPVLYVEPDGDMPRSSYDTECGNSSSTEVFPGALTYIDVADEDSRDVNITGSIQPEDVEEVISSADQSSGNPEFSPTRRESIESLGSVHEHRTENNSCDMKQGGKEVSSSAEQIYVERGTLSQPISIEDSQRYDGNSDTGDKQKSTSKTVDHSVNVRDISDPRRNRLKLPKHKPTGNRIDSQTVEQGAGATSNKRTTEIPFGLGTVTVVDCSSDDEVPIITKAPDQRPSGQAIVSSRNTHITQPKNLSSNETKAANANDKITLKSTSVTYTGGQKPTVKSPEKCSPTGKNMLEAEHNKRREKTETPKKSQTPEHIVKVPEKGSPAEPIDVDECDPGNKRRVTRDKGSMSQPINIDGACNMGVDRVGPSAASSKIPRADIKTSPPLKNNHDSPPNKRRVTPDKGSVSQPINVDGACSMGVDRVGPSAASSTTLRADIKTSPPPKNNHHSPPNSVVRSRPTIRLSPEVKTKISTAIVERQKVQGELEKSDRNTSTQHSKEAQKKADSSPKSSSAMLNKSCDIIEIDDDSLVGSPEKTPAKLPTAAAAVQRPSSQPSVPAPKVQTVDLTSPPGKKKFDPKATINIMNKVLAQSNANTPAVFTQTIADMISKVSADVFSEKAGSSQKMKNTIGNQSGQSGNRRQNVGAPAGANRAPGSVNQTLGVVNRAPAGVNQTLGGVNRAQAGVNRAPAGVNRAPGSVNRAPGVGNRAPAGVNQTLGLVNRAPGGVNRTPGGVNRAPGGPNHAPIPNRTPISPSQSDSRRRLNTSRVIPKSFQTNQAALVESAGQQKVAGVKNGVTYYTRPLANARDPSRIATLPDQKSTACPQLKAAASGSTVNPQPLILVQNTANVKAARSTARQNPPPSQPVFNRGEGNQTQVVGNQRPMVGNQRPVVGNQRPVVGNQKPIGNQKPTIGNQRPIIASQRPVVGNQRPVVGNQRPVGGNQRQMGGNQRQMVSNQRILAGRIKPVSPRSASTGRHAQGSSQSYTFNRNGVVISPRSNRPISASSMRLGQRPNGANNKHLSPRQLSYPASAPSRVVSGQGRGQTSEVNFQNSVRHKALTSTPQRVSRSPTLSKQIAIGQEGGLKIMSYSSLATGMTVPVQSAQQKRPISRPPTTGNVSREQEGAKKPKIETVVLSDSD